MNEDLLKFDEYLTYIGDKLQKPAEFVYDMLLKQVYFEVVWAGVWVLIALASLIFVWKGLYPKALYNLNKGSEEMGLLQGVVIGVVTLIMPFVVGINLYNVLLILINPHWYMIQLAASLVT